MAVEKRSVAMKPAGDVAVATDRGSLQVQVAHRLPRTSKKSAGASSTAHVNRTGIKIRDVTGLDVHPGSGCAPYGGLAPAGCDARSTLAMRNDR